MQRDPGAANERTALAWQRTALSLLAGSAILSRITLDRLGLAAMTSVVVAVPLGSWVFFESRARYRQSAGLQRRGRPRGGRAAAALAIATVCVGLTELAALVVDWQG
jgi:uncharacterized membrane protein YidH (DUF202 family)